MSRLNRNFIGMKLDPKSHAKTFIKKYATADDLKELQKLIEELLQGNH